MKMLTNTVKALVLAGVMSMGLTSCEKQDYDMLTAEAPENSGFSITSSIDPDYFLSKKNADNVAMTFSWTPVEYNVNSPVKYSIEGSVNADFSTVEFKSAGTENTTQNLTVRDLLKLAENGGLDGDPETIGKDGEANNSGELYFRVRAFLGTVEAANNANTFTEVIGTSVEIEEIIGSGIEISNWGLVGSAVNNWGATPDIPLYTTKDEGVFVAYPYLKDGAMKIRENNAWDVNFGDNDADGSLENGGADINVTEGRYKIMVDFNANTYTLEPYTFGIVGSAWNDWGGAGPDAPFYYDYTTDTFKAGVKLLEGAMKVRFNNAWDLNYGDNNADGTLEEGGADILVSEGYYLITINMNDLTIDIQENANVLGVVGSAYNDWGATADAYLTEIQPGVFYADGINLLDGAMKFRYNESWDLNYGDNNADFTLEEGGADIVTTAGQYRINVILAEGETPSYTVE